MKQVTRHALAPGSVPVWQPTEHDLAAWARVLLEDAYLLRPRRKCSQQDFAAGFLGALVALRWRPAFGMEHDEMPFPGRAFPLPGLVEAFVAVGPGSIPDGPSDPGRDGAVEGGGPAPEMSDAHDR